MHIWLVERRQVLVVETDALAVLAVIGLELFCGVWIVNNRVDSAAKLFHRLEIAEFHFGEMLRRFNSCLRIAPHDIGPTVVHDVDLGHIAGDCFREVHDSFLLPTGLKALKPRFVSGAVSSNTDSTRRALEDKQILRRFGKLRNGLNRSSASSDNADALVAKLVHEFARTTAGVVVIPTAGVEHASLELLDTRNAGNLRLMKNAASDHDVLRTDLVAT
ncbi:unannotated protein [freshwater metagenome]|uniref:Unannotated protein n=1 Tax=freshwater metagenome TaxID=449393 RepID=A0A6J6XYG8_9ZZZZ